MKHSYNHTRPTHDYADNISNYNRPHKDNTIISNGFLLHAFLKSRQQRAPVSQPKRPKSRSRKQTRKPETSSTQMQRKPAQNSKIKLSSITTPSCMRVHTYPPTTPPTQNYFCLLRLHLTKKKKNRDISLLFVFLNR